MALFQGYDRFFTGFVFTSPATISALFSFQVDGADFVYFNLEDGGDGFGNLHLVGAGVHFKNILVLGASWVDFSVTRGYLTML